MDATTEAPEVTDAQKPAAELFRYSSWLHVGIGAEDCEGGELGVCEDPRHFHAWCRMPNQFQHQDIRERALGAKARRIRQLHDPNADAHEILEADMETLLRVGDRDVLIDELVGKDWWKRQLDAMREVESREEYETVERDRERMAELRRLSEAERNQDEFGELERHLRAYGEAVEAEREKTERPLRDGLEAMEMAELVDQVREDRIAAEASTIFMETYSKYQWLAGTFTTADPITRKHRFASLESLMGEAPEVVEALRVVYSEMETSLQRGPVGN